MQHYHHHHEHQHDDELHWGHDFVSHLGLKYMDEWDDSRFLHLVWFLRDWFFPKLIHVLQIVAYVYQMQLLDQLLNLVAERMVLFPNLHRVSVITYKQRKTQQVPNTERMHEFCLFLSILNIESIDGWFVFFCVCVLFRMSFKYAKHWSKFRDSKPSNQIATSLSEALSSVPFNRIPFGLQTLHSKVPEKMGKMFRKYRKATQ